MDDFVIRLPELAGPLARLVQMIRFQLAPLECEAAVRKSIEAAIADHFYAHGERLVREFQDDDIYYDRTALAEPLIVRCRFACPIRGAPDVLSIGTPGAPATGPELR